MESRAILSPTGFDPLLIVFLAIALVIAGVVALILVRGRTRAWIGALAIVGLATGGLALSSPQAALAAGGVTATADTASITEDSAPNLVVGNVITNDIDTDDDPLAVTSAGTFTLDHGTLVLNTDGSYTYALDNSNPAVNALNSGQMLTDTFIYSISDGNGGTDSATLTVTIHGVTDNHPPVAGADTDSVTEDTAPNPVIGNVLANDSDADGNTLAVTSAGTFTLAYGTLVVHQDGSYTYTLNNSNPVVNALNDGQQLVDRFTYSISDGHGGADSATLTVTIHGVTDNHAPVAGADTDAVTEDTAPNPVIGNVLTNDSDADGNTLTVTSAGTFTLDHGLLVVNADGSYTYTLDNSNPAVNALNDGQTLTDTFTYNISDGHGGTDSSTLTVTIHGVTDNRPPIAMADASVVTDGAAPNPITGNVLVNDSDPDGDTLSVTNAGTFTLGHGTLVLNADGSYTYTLDNSNSAVSALSNGQTLTDTFVYNVSDGHGGTNSATLIVTINGPTSVSLPSTPSTPSTPAKEVLAWTGGTVGIIPFAGALLSIVCGVGLLLTRRKTKHTLD